MLNPLWLLFSIVVWLKKTTSLPKLYLSLDKNTKIKTDSLDITYCIIYTYFKKDCSEAFKTRTFNITVA